MNVEHLHAIAIEVKNELDSSNIPNQLAQLVGQLQNVVNQPQQAQHQQQAGNSRKVLRELLTDAPSNDFSPAWQQALQELGLFDLLGVRLLKQIEDAFVGNDITPQLAFEAIRALHTRLQGAHEALNNIISGFQTFGIGHEVLSPGEAELGILLPRQYLDNRFDKLAIEFKKINWIFSVLAEVGTGSAQTLEIKALSTSDPFIVLGSGLAVLSTIAIAVKPIISAYKEILEVRLLHAKLAEMNVSEERLKGVEEHVSEIMQSAVSKIKDELLQKSPVENEGRKNELEVALGSALNMLANRIDRGVNIEIRIEPFEEESASEDDEQRQHVREIQDAMSEMEFINVVGTPILQLPEKKEEDQS